MPFGDSLAWAILAAAAYKDVRGEVLPAIRYRAQSSRRTLVEDPKTVEDTSTIALAALALGPDGANNPFEVKVWSPIMSRPILSGSLLAGTGVLAVRRLRSTGFVPDRRRPQSRVAILHVYSYTGPLDRTLIAGILRL
jgi:hypothetical protein